jgi:hypothetical protein
VGKDCAERVEKGVDSNGNPPFWVESCFDSAVSHQKNCLHCRNSHLRVCPQFKRAIQVASAGELGTESRLIS